MKKAFSLIELSIVLAIIALLTTSIIAGSKMINQAKIKKVIDEMENIQAAIGIFKLEFKSLPGDLKTASAYWSTANDGDGDGSINLGADSAASGSSEVGNAFKHLSYADLVPGSYETGNTLKTTPKLGYPSQLKGVAYIITDYTMARSSPIGRNHISGTESNVIRLGKTDSSSSHTNTHVGYGVFSIEDAKNIDVKLDDGIARSGNVSGHNEYLAATTSAVGCLKFPSGTTSDSTGEASYNLGASDLCNMSFNLHIAD